MVFSFTLKREFNYSNLILKANCPFSNLRIFALRLLAKILNIASKSSIGRLLKSSCFASLSSKIMIGSNLPFSYAHLYISSDHPSRVFQYTLSFSFFFREPFCLFLSNQFINNFKYILFSISKIRKGFLRI